MSKAQLFKIIYFSMKFVTRYKQSLQLQKLDVVSTSLFICFVIENAKISERIQVEVLLKETPRSNIGVLTFQFFPRFKMAAAILPSLT